MAEEESVEEAEFEERRTAKAYVYLAVGWLFVVIGGIGVLLPVIPTTPFLLISVWAFSKSSPRLMHWLYSHRYYGPYLIAWNKYHVIPLQAKFLAVLLMGTSWVWYTFYLAESWVIPAIIAAIEIAVLSYILTRPSAPPVDVDE